MNKNVVKITVFVAGVITALVALFSAISGIIDLTNFNGNVEARWNAWFAVSAVLDFAVAAGLGVISYFVIKEFIKNEEGKKHWFLCATATYFTYLVVSTLIFMIIANSWDSAMNWVRLVFSVAGCVLAVVALMGKVNDNNSKIVAAISVVIAFVVVVLGLVNAGGLGIAIGVFLLLMFISYFVYYVFEMVLDGTFKANTNDNTEVKEEAKAEEPKQEEAKPEATEETKEVETKEE